jgi:hypothetical protein
VDELNCAIAKYLRHADEIEDLLSNYPAAAFVRPPGVGWWSIPEIAARLADAESPASARIHSIITCVAKHQDQIRLAAVVYEDSNNKPQDRLRVREERK